MSFLDKVKEAASAGVEGAKDLGEIGKLKIKVSEDENKINGLLLEVGKKLVEENPDVFAQLFPEQSQKLAEYKAILADLKQQIEAVKAKN